jgi:protein-tyrosine phosphatase
MWFRRRRPGYGSHVIETAGDPLVRSLGLAGAPNARDLGGLIGHRGARIRSGRLIRSPGLGYLTAEDTACLAGIGVKTVLDLRYEGEVRHAPPDRLPDGIRVTHLPIFDPAFPVFTVVGQLLQGEGETEYADILAQGTPAAMTAIYRWFVADPLACQHFGASLRHIADAATAPVLFHCSAGKDRTGWLTLIVLTALGVQEADIRRDYLDTNTHGAAVVERILAAMLARRPDLDRDVVRPLFEARTEFLDAALDEVSQRYGTFDAYLREGLGITRDERDALRANLLER